MSTRKGFLFIAALALMTLKLHSVHADCRSDLVKIDSLSVLTIQENSRAGEVLMNITDDYDKLTFEIPTDSFVTNDTGSIVARVDVFLDGPENAENCAKSTNSLSSKFFCNDDPGNGKTVTIMVNITNDFGPYFTVFETNVTESLPVGSTVIDLNSIVVDNDCTSTSSFVINDEKSRQTFKVLDNRLVLLGSLDYEVQTEHLINLTATTYITGGRGQMSNTTILTIRVLDEDDMSPVFNISQFVLRVPEGQDVSAFWYNTTPPILAFDGDVGVNEPLVYSVHALTPNIKLQINNDSGEVKILEQLDRENIPAYTVVVKASQKDVAYKTATATLSLLVDDVNDNRPVFIKQLPVTIMENAPDGSYVMDLSGEDQDEGDNSLFDFIITNDSVGAFKSGFQTNSNKTVLIVANSTALRGQVQAVVQFYLKERRQIVGQPCTNTTNCVGDVTIYITDVNDNSPEFNAPSYTFPLPSNTSGRYIIGQVLAHDRDRGDNAVVKYSLTFISGPSDCSSVALNLTTGILTTEQQLPPGAICSWVVTACDSPTDSNSRCSFVSLTIAVVPSGNVVENSVTIPENMPTGTMVKPLPIKGLHTTSTEFEIRTDVLYTKVMLDREHKDQYEVTITTGQNASSVVMIVYVNVSDVNDNAPVFGQSVYVVNIDRGWTINQTVLQVNATDKDIGINSRVTFSMATGKEYFDIDPTTGHVRLTNFPTARDSEYQLLVTDSGQPSFSRMSTLRVYNPVHNETATVLLPVNRDELLADREGLARKLGSILGLTVTIHNIESLGPAADLGSKVFISAKSAQGQPISPTDLNELLEARAKEIYNNFSKSIPRGENINDRILSVLEIVLICLASVLLLLLLLVAFLWYRSNKKLRQSRRLFDSLNKDTTIYDNPRKPSSSATAVAGSSSNSTNAQRLMARLSSGSLGNSSVTNLLSAQRDDNNSEGVTPPGSNGSQRRQNNDYQNGFIAPLSSGVIINDSTEDTPPDEAHAEQITTFSSHIRDDGLTDPSYPYLNTVDSEGNQPDYAPSQTWLGDDTAFSGRRGSDVDSGTISDKETQLEDEDDKEVADILSDQNPLTHSREDTVDSPINRSNLDLMTTSNQIEESLPKGIDNAAYLDTENSNLPPEPEPDYAKRVRFSESPAPVENNESVSQPESDDKDLSLAKFLNQYGGTENLATDADTAQDSFEEMTAL